MTLEHSTSHNEERAGGTGHHRATTADTTNNNCTNIKNSVPLENSTAQLAKISTDINKKTSRQEHSVPSPHPMKIIWSHMLFYVVLHAMAVAGAWRLLSASPLTLAFAVFWHMFGGVGVTAGAHRLWSHRSYRAAWPVRLLLMVAFSVSAQTHLEYWVRNHRIHHRHSETDGDPHDARRGFLFAHFTWLVVEKHPECQRLYERVDISDLRADPIVQFHQRFFWPLTAFLGFILPAALPYWLWNDSATTGLLVAGALRYVVTFHSTWLVNSAAHMWGNRPYDATIGPTENWLVTTLAGGEGWHNYHHSFPWDYRTGEVPGLGNNATRALIDLWARYGLVWDRKVASEDVISRRVERIGDGSPRSGTSMSEHIQTSTGSVNTVY